MSAQQNLFVAQDLESAIVNKDNTVTFNFKAPDAKKVQIAGDFAERAEDNALRERLNAQYDELGGEAMIETLRGFDPERAAKLHPADKRRIVRAIEIYTLTGETITEHDEKTGKRPKKYDAVKIALSFADRAMLYDRINERVDKMVADGLFDEVKGLLDSGLSPDCTAMQAIGYKEPAAYFAGKITKDEATELIKLSSRRYAKRQLTWLRRDETVKWYEWPSSPDFNEARRFSTEYLHSCGL